LNLQQQQQQHQTLQSTIDSVAATTTPNLLKDDYEEDVVLVPIDAAAKALEDDCYDTFTLKNKSFYCCFIDDCWVRNKSAH
jgi:hypothetical protein